MSPSRSVFVNRWLILDHVRRNALLALEHRDSQRFRRCSAILVRDGQRRMREYTAQRKSSSLALAGAP